MAAPALERAKAGSARFNSECFRNSDCRQDLYCNTYNSASLSVSPIIQKNSTFASSNNTVSVVPGKCQWRGRINEYCAINLHCMESLECVSSKCQFSKAGKAEFYGGMYIFLVIFFIGFAGFVLGPFISALTKHDFRDNSSFSTKNMANYSPRKPLVKQKSDYVDYDF